MVKWYSILLIITVSVRKRTLSQHSTGTLHSPVLQEFASTSQQSQGYAAVTNSPSRVFVHATCSLWLTSFSGTRVVEQLSVKDIRDCQDTGKVLLSALMLGLETTHISVQSSLSRVDYTYLCKYRCVFGHVHTRRPELSPITLHLMFLRRGLSLNVELTHLVRLSGQCAPGLYLPAFAS